MQQFLNCYKMYFKSKKMKFEMITYTINIFFLLQLYIGKNLKSFIMYKTLHYKYPEAEYYLCDKFAV